MRIPGKHYTFFAALLIAALVFSLAVPTRADALGRDTHASMASYAKMLANHNLVSDTLIDVPEWMEEINQYVPDEYCPVNNALCDLDEYYDLTVGAANEDEIDHIWNHVGIYDACVTITHFWDPDLGPDATMNSAT